MKKQFISLLFIFLWASFYTQPTGTCTTGATQLGTDGVLYGCVETSWRRLSELSTATAAIPATLGITQNVNGGVYVREMNNNVRDLRNIGFVPVALTGQTHEVGKIIYDATKKHFYQGVSGGLWHQIDNQTGRQCLGQPMPGWNWFPPGTKVLLPNTCGDNIDVVIIQSPGIWLMKARCLDGDIWTGCFCKIGPSSANTAGWETECP